MASIACFNDMINISSMPCNAASKVDRQTQQELMRRELADAERQPQRLLDAMDQSARILLRGNPTDHDV